MANSETVDLMSIGAHCAVASCRQNDFLPFTCAACGGTFCLEHRTHSAHQCPARPANATEGQAIVCPVCAHAIKLRPGQDGNDAFEAHARSGACDPSNYARVHRKQSCPVSGCREKMTTLNRYRCKKCGLEVCMSHRLPGDHGCDARMQARRLSNGSVQKDSQESLERNAHLQCWPHPQPCKTACSSSVSNDSHRFNVVFEIRRLAQHGSAADSRGPAAKTRGLPAVWWALFFCPATQQPR